MNGNMGYKLTDNIGYTFVRFWGRIGRATSFVLNVRFGGACLFRPASQSYGVIRRIRLCWRATGAADFANGACRLRAAATGPPCRCGSIAPGLPPLAQCGKLRGGGGWPP